MPNIAKGEARTSERESDGKGKETTDARGEEDVPSYRLKTDRTFYKVKPRRRGRRGNNIWKTEISMLEEKDIQL